ncbi:MAG: 30S ribosomal protein S2 [Deltaproteobacteria bacterium]|nr:30S ribosomal protein S2 [Deltaproteobacteria bacterium]
MGVFASNLSMQALLEAGVHFGHQTQRWNPKMKPYIFGKRDGIYIIDLEQTVALAQKASDFARTIAEEGGTLLFVGTKKQAQEIIREEAGRCGMFYVVHRWLGGMLTNYRTIRASINKLKDLQKKLGDSEYIDRLPKKEVLLLDREKNRLEASLGGIQNMFSLPKALFIVDPAREDIAVQEARKLNIPIIAIVDTNCDPDLIDHIIPGNDDSIRSVKLFTSMIADAILEGKERHQAALRGEGAVKPLKEETKEGKKAEKGEEKAPKKKEPQEETQEPADDQT